MLKHKALFLGLMAVLVAGFALGGQAIPNWAAPATWSPPRSAGVHTMTDVTFMLPFIGVTPCRIWDTRGNGFAGQYGPPSLVANTPRSFTIAGQCGIPVTAQAVSFNIGALNVGGNGDLRVYPAGGVAPFVSTMNYSANTPNIANAAVVPLGAGGAITLLADTVPIDTIGDVNGYYAPMPLAGSNGLLIENNNPGAPVLIGRNDSATGAASGVLGVISSTAPAGTSAGVRGINNGTTTNGIGVWGSQDGSGVGVEGSVPNGIGVAGVTTGTTAGTAVLGLSGAGDGVVGLSLATTGQTFGVVGESLSTSFFTSQAGVRGMDSSGYNPTDLFNQSGVLGTAQDFFGVSGKSRFIAVYGQLMTTADAHAQFGVLGSTFGTAADLTTGPWGVFSAGNFGATGGKHFVEPDPREPNGVILYSSLEGREVGTYFRGTARSSGGRAVIEIPEDFRIVTDDNGLTVQLTPVGAFSQMYVESQDLNQIVVHSSRDVTFHYLVQGVRRAFKDFSPLAKGYEFMPLFADAHMPLWLTEEAKRRLIANGTYNADGTVNMVTAERVGWTKIWADRQAETEAAAKKAREAATSRLPRQ